MRETDIIPKGIVKRQKSTFEPLGSSSLRSQDSLRAVDLGIRRAYTETRTIRAKLEGDLREVLVTVLRESPPFSMRKKPPDIDLSYDKLKVAPEKSNSTQRLLLMDTFSETSTEVPQTPKYAYTDNEDESEGDATGAAISSNSRSHIDRLPANSAPELAERAANHQLSWMEVFVLLAGFWLATQITQSLVQY